MSSWLWLLVITAGASGQFIDAVAGMGFGAFSSTIMVAGGVSPVLVVGTVNVAKVGSGFVSGLSHWRLGNVRWLWVWPLMVAGVVGGVGAAMMLAQMPVEVTRVGVPVVLLGMGVLISYRFLFGAALLPRVAGGSGDLALARPQGMEDTLVKALPTLRLGGIGMVAGVLNGISGAFGPFATSAVLLSHPKQPRYAIGTVNFVEFFVAAAISATLFWRVGLTEFQWQLPLALVVGSILTAPVGAYLARRVPARSLGILVGVALIGINAWSIANRVL